MRKEKGKMKKEKAMTLTSATFHISLLLFTFAAQAATYGTLNAETNLVAAPPTVKIGNAVRVTAHIAESEANALGYKLAEDVRPTCASNEYAVAVGWAQTNRIYRVYEKRVVEPLPRKFSKLKIYGAIISLPDANGMSAWAKVQTWLEGKTIGGVNGWTAFMLAQEISEDHPLFAPLAEEARQLLGLTDEQFDALLNACILES